MSANLSIDAVIWTEGKTDLKHLKKAFEVLEVDLNIQFKEHENGDMGVHPPSLF